jgi:hypothetical protein
VISSGEIPLIRDRRSWRQASPFLRHVARRPDREGAGVEAGFMTLHQARIVPLDRTRKEVLLGRGELSGWRAPLG